MYASIPDLEDIEYVPAIARGTRISALEIHYPRICRELIQKWFRHDIDAYLDSLIVDDRTDRQGFPMEVFDELLFLSDLRWAISHHFAAIEAGPVDTDDFTFVASQVRPASKPKWRF